MQKKTLYPNKEELVIQLVKESQTIRQRKDGFPSLAFIISFPHNLVCRGGKLLSVLRFFFQIPPNLHNLHIIYVTL